MNTRQRTPRTTVHADTKPTTQERDSNVVAPRSPNAPTHEVFSVIRREGRDKAIWHKVGACWPHDDGDGFSITLDYLPLNGGELVMRKWKPKSDAAANDAREGGAA
jgi:hypothetical protein